MQINLIHAQLFSRSIILSQLYNNNNYYYYLHYMYTIVLVDRYYNNKRRHNDILNIYNITTYSKFLCGIFFSYIFDVIEFNRMGLFRIKRISIKP